MSRYNGPVCRLCRREGQKLFLKGPKCFTEKCPVDRRTYPPGPHGPAQARRRKQSEYLLQLREKQKARRYYGLLEKQFRTYYSKAAKASGITGEALLRLLETRLDNVVYRLGFAGSRAQARQLVRHGHFLVDDPRDLELHQRCSGCQSESFRWSLLRVELDDELFLNGGVDLLPLGPLEHLAGDVLVVGLEPGGN